MVYYVVGLSIEQVKCDSLREACHSYAGCCRSCDVTEVRHSGEAVAFYGGDLVGAGPLEAGRHEYRRPGLWDERLRACVRLSRAHPQLRYCRNSRWLRWSRVWSGMCAVSGVWIVEFVLHQASLVAPRVDQSSCVESILPEWINPPRVVRSSSGGSILLVL